MVIVGESKSQLSRNDVEKFVTEQLPRFDGVFDEEIIPVLVTNRITSAGVEKYVKDVKKWRIGLYFSHDF